MRLTIVNHRVSKRDLLKLDSGKKRETAKWKWAKASALRTTSASKSLEEVTHENAKVAARLLSTKVGIISSNVGATREMRYSRQNAFAFYSA